MIEIKAAYKYLKEEELPKVDGISVCKYVDDDGLIIVEYPIGQFENNAEDCPFLTKDDIEKINDSGIELILFHN